MTTFVFLHIPKTAGQTVHAELQRLIGPEQTSPVRVHTQAAPDAQFPPGYRLYSGHLDWTGLARLPTDRFVFTVLRDPFERIASFYFYLLEKARKLDDATLAAPENTGMRMIKTCSTDDYFFGGTGQWQRFIQDHYNNFYCTYFATRKMRGWADISALPKTDLMSQATMGARDIDAIYTLDSLPRLEDDLHSLSGVKVHLAGNRTNPGPQPANTKRWPHLLARLEHDSSAALLEQFTLLDIELMTRIDLR